MDAMLELAAKSPDQPLAIAVVADQSGLISYAKMDRCRVIPQRMAIRKAYTCAVTGQDSNADAERLASQGRSVAEMGDQAMSTCDLNVLRVQINRHHLLSV